MAKQLTDQVLTRKTHSASTDSVVLLLSQELVRVLAPSPSLRLRDPHEGHQQLQEATSASFEQCPELRAKQHRLDQLHKLRHELCGSIVLLLAGSAIVRMDNGLGVARVDLLHQKTSRSQHRFQRVRHHRPQRPKATNGCDGAHCREGALYTVTVAPTIHACAERSVDGQPRWQRAKDRLQSWRRSLWGRDDRVHARAMHFNALAPERWR
mmetsp:Transcript_81814/g.212903  ORF Transcript_81814/g.212903 Transcript_81814/m.212903 type:complete len:210 (+) Transcript_81814:2097-2726(+)